MKIISLTFILLIATISCFAFNSESRLYKLSDGEEVLGRLCTPDNGDFTTLVFITHGTGIQNHLNLRKGVFNFNYYDELAKEFCSRGLAVFTYDRRGVTVDENGEPPYFSKVDSVAYLKYAPLREAEDIENVISMLKKDERLANSKIILYGLSEGTITSTLVAEREKQKIDALFLHEYANENMYDIVRWQIRDMVR